MSSVAIAGGVSLMVTINASVVWTVESMGFTEEQIKGQDSLHITVRSGSAICYWYAKESPTLTPSTGHEIKAGAERIIRDIRNIRHFQIMAQSGSSVLAVTLGAY